MGDLDAILQDFSYLTSLAHKNQAPKKLSAKLFLPDPSVVHAIKHVFEKSGEATFERIFNRPLGYRVFQEFVFSELGKQDKPAVALFKFNNEVKELSSEVPATALERIKDLQRRFIDAEEISAAGVWASATVEALRARVERLAVAVAEDRGRGRNVNIKEIFSPFLPEARAYIAQKPWAAFLESPFWTRYCQWKHLELNFQISEADFEVHRILGRGGFGEVFGCRKLDTGAMFAMKKLDKRRLKSKHQETSAVHERNVLAEMHSKFVTNLKYAFHDRETLYLVLDLMEGGDLNFHLRTRGTLNENEARFYSAEIILGLAHIHARNMIYRDLKPANILLDAQGHARISDLGLVRDLSRSLPTSECGTHGYMAPEVLLPDTPYSQGADWWSLGCVIYQLLAGYTPFRGPEKAKVTKEEIDRRTHSMTITYPDTFSPEVKDLLSQLLDRDQSSRLGCRGRGAAEVRAHPWFDAVDWPAMIDQKIAPPFRPSMNQVNAHDVHEIDRFDTWDLRGVHVTPADDEKYYSHFEHIMSHHWQEEILGSVYDMIVKRADTLEAKASTRIAAQASEPEVTAAVMQGYLLKKGGMLGGFHRRYVVLLPDRIEWRKEQRQAVVRALSLADVLRVEVGGPLANPMLNIIPKDGRIVVFKAESPSDFECWTELLKREHARVQQSMPSPPASASETAVPMSKASSRVRMSMHEDTLEADGQFDTISPLPPRDSFEEEAHLRRTISQTSARVRATESEAEDGP